MRNGQLPHPRRPLARLSLAEALGRLDGDLVAEAQQLRDHDTYRAEDRGAGLHVATVDEPDGTVVETELQLAGAKIRDYRCDCHGFAERERCVHVAAIFSGVEVARQARRARSPTARRRPQTASTKRLLESVDEGDLRAFVVEYARRHPDFALDLRVRFAEALPVANRFEQVVVKLLRRSADAYSPSQARRIREALQQFAGQRERYLAERSFLDLFELNTVLIPRLAVVIDKAARVRIDLAGYVDDCLRELAEVVRSNPPPVLLERLERWLAEQLERGTYFRHGLAPGIAELVDALAADDGSRALDVLAEGERRYGTLDGVAVAKTAILYRHGRAAEARSLLMDHLGDAPLVAQALQLEIASGKLERAVKLAGAAYEQQTDPADRLRLARFLTAEAAVGTLPGLLERFGPEVVLADGSTAVLRGATEALGDDGQARSAAQASLRRLAERDARDANAEALRAELLAFIGDYRELENLLYRSRHPAVIARFLPSLVGQLDDADVALVLDTKIREHLVDRFGRHPAEWTARLLDEVAKRSRTELAGPIASGIRRDFNQRPALLEALDAALL